jgi:hypothetical protein
MSSNTPGNAKMQHKKRQKKKTGEREFLVETEILTWLNRQPGVFAFKVETGGYYNKNKGFYQRRRSKFNIKGTSDIIGCYKGQFFAIEVKREKGGVLSVHQKRFIQQVQAMGGKAGVARSILDAANIIGLQCQIIEPTCTE